jgi:hypothetical protein
MCLLSLEKKTPQEIKDTKKVFSNRSQKIGDFDIQYFEDDAEFKDLVDRGLVVQNASIDEAGGQPVAIHQPDNLLVGNVNYKGKKIMEGNGGIYYVLKFGNVWASGKQNSAKTLAIQPLEQLQRPEEFEFSKDWAIKSFRL